MDFYGIEQQLVSLSCASFVLYFVLWPITGMGCLIVLVMFSTLDVSGRDSWVPGLLDMNHQ